MATRSEARPGAIGQRATMFACAVTNFPYVLLSCAVSVDGFIDDTSVQRLLSNDEDFDRLDAVRAEADAILVGATTIRRDNPRLLVRAAERRQARVSCDKPDNPIKVTISGSGVPERGRGDPSQQPGGCRATGHPAQVAGHGDHRLPRLAHAGGIRGAQGAYLPVEFRAGVAEGLGDLGDCPHPAQPVHPPGDMIGARASQVRP